MAGFRLATFNLENLGSETPEGLEVRLPILRPQISRLNADILCLQEVNAPRQRRQGGGGARGLHGLDVLLEGTDAGSFHRRVTHQKGKPEPRDVHNLIVLSRFAILKAEQYHHDLVPPIDLRLARDVDTQDDLVQVRFDRPLLYVAVQLADGETLHLINLHLRAPSGSFISGQKTGPFQWKSVPGWAEAFYMSSLKRGGQALEARLLVDRIFDEDADALIAVCGDFNAEEDEVPLKLLIAGDEDTGNGALAWRSLIPLERSLPKDRVFSVIHRGKKQMLDHILVSARLLGRFSSLEIHNETLGDEAYAYEAIENPPESFHAPLVASFRSGVAEN